MLKSIISIAAPLALAAVLAAPSAAAAAVEPVSVTIPYADLDLSRPEGVAQLGRRVSAALNRMCGATDGRTLPERLNQRACMADARARATPRLVRIVRTAQAGQTLESLAQASPSPFAER